MYGCLLWIMFHLIFYAILPNEVLYFGMVNIHTHTKEPVTIRFYDYSLS